jgi:uncharacterized protein
MHLELKDIDDHGLEQGYSCSIESFPGLLDLQEHEDTRFTAPLDFRLRLQKSGQIVTLNGSVTTCIACVCGHCLQKFEQPVVSDFVLIFTPQSNAAAAEESEEVELDAEELGLVYYQNDTLELLQPLQDQVLMALPMSPLCSEDCRGLCLECGCDLNINTCQCEKKAFNNKFTALAGLKLDTSD